MSGSRRYEVGDVVAGNGGLLWVIADSNGRDPLIVRLMDEPNSRLTLLPAFWVAPATSEEALTPGKSIHWLNGVVPYLLQGGETNAILKLRIAALWEEAKVAAAFADAVKMTLDRINDVVVRPHGSSVSELPPEVAIWAEGVHREDQRATDELCHWIFENAPAKTNKYTLARLVGEVSIAGRPKPVWEMAQA